MNEETTIIALATAPSPSAIAVIRLSGPDALDIVTRRWKGVPLDTIRSHSVHLGKITDEEAQEIDTVVLTYFKGPHSYTGENTVEISTHGSPAIAAEVIRSLTTAGATPATKGEYTRRAFLNGRLDLTQAEAVADMIASDSALSRRVALAHLKGDITDKISSLSEELLELSGLLELELDFSEEDVTFADRKRLRNLAGEIVDTLTAMASSYRTGKAMRDGVEVAIIGIPNSGKSTLLNRLLGDDRAIVSDTPGTTRDIIEDTADIHGIKMRFIDTAGLRTTNDTVENLGIEKALRRAKNAEVIIPLIDASGNIPEQQQYIYDTLGEIPEETQIVTVLNKTDISPDTDLHGTFKVSAATGQGIETLLSHIAEKVTGKLDPSTDLILTNARHYTLIKKALGDISRARQAIETGLSADLIAEDIRATLRTLDEITGRITSTAILHHIFSSFCVGK